MQPVIPLAPAESTSPRAILVVDDHELVRLGLRTLLLTHVRPGAPPLEVLEARTLQAALNLHAGRAAEIAVTLLDLHLPDAYGLAGLEALLAAHPGARIVVLSGSTDPVLRRRALELGAVAFLSKSADLQLVVEHLFAAEPSEGEARAAPHLGAQKAHDTDDFGDPRDPIEVGTADGRRVRLTRRQLQVLERVLAGQSNRQIADQTHLTEGTIKNHVSALLLLFGARSRSQLISLLR
jgi:DNA-binding NarL/FixJ family response regulator